MLIGCGDCEPTATCEVKVLAAIITPAGFTGSVCTSNPSTSPVVQEGCNNYCQDVYTMTDGPDDCTPVTTCGAITNIVTWLLSQWTSFQNDTSYPWNTYTTAFFENGSSSTPYCITGPGSTTGFGAPSYGSNYTVGYPLVALNGTTDGNVCAYAQLVAMRMSGNLFLTPLDVPGVTESCLDTSADGICSASGNMGSGTYYIPMPPLDLCSNPEEGGIQIGYLPFQTGNTVDCLPAYTGGAYTTCLSPDPFFGSDPP
jgi:hypothetical protein